MNSKGSFEMGVTCPTSWTENKLPDIGVITCLGIPHSVENTPIIIVHKAQLLAAEA